MLLGREIREVYRYTAFGRICTEEDLKIFANHIINKIRTPTTIRINVRIWIRNEPHVVIFETENFQYPLINVHNEKIQQIVQKIILFADLINIRDTIRWSFTAFHIDIV